MFLIKDYKKYILALIASLFLVHFIYASFLSFVTTKINTHRLVNLRKLDDQYFRFVNYRSIISSFLRSNVAKNDKPIILILGSSFSYGYSWSPKNIYSHKLQELMKNYKVINLSMIGGNGIALFLYTLKTLEKLKINIDTIIIENNLINFYTTSKQTTEIFERAKFIEYCDLFLPPYLMFYLSNLFGFQGIEIAIDEYNYKQEDKIFKKTNNKTDYFKTRTDFNKSLAFSEEKLNEIFEVSSKISNKIYYFISPILKDGINESITPKEIVLQMNLLKKECLKHEKITCLNPYLENEYDNYFDLSHLSQKGHQQFSEKFFKILAAQ